VAVVYFRFMELKGLHIGIISLGWLGQKLAMHLAANKAEVWGTVSTEEKSNRINENTIIEALVWQSNEGISNALKSKLSATDILVLNLPPSVFSNETYAQGLSQFLPFLHENAKVIFTSSTSVYPNDLEDAVESYVFKDGEINKIGEAEAKLSSLLSDRLTILRLAGLIGEDRNPVYYLAKKEMNDNPDKPVNLIHRQDIIQIIEKLIRLDYFGQILNVCNPEHPSRENYYSKKAKQFKLPELNFSQQVLNEVDKVVNCAKLKDTIGYTKFVKL
jgi:nucleoside-diphosphate-sugar epimerase